MSNPYKDYFIAQAGSGISGFTGVKYQRGHGFFGRLLSKAVFPLMRFLGKKAANVGANIASDVILNQKDLTESAKSRFAEGGKDVLNAGINRAKKFVVEGKGRKRRRTKIIKGLGRKRKRRVVKGSGKSKKRKTSKRKKYDIDQLMHNG